ncbi:MAG: endonuclease domain-containing protein [Saprospiraceae bacterium]
MRIHDAIHFARNLRKNPTESEKYFWELIRKRKVHNLKFLRQFKIEHSNINVVKNYFFVDLYCHQIKLIVEIDGQIHLQQKEYDQERQAILEGIGYKVIRIRNDEVKNKSTINDFVNSCKSLIQKME